MVGVFVCVFSVAARVASVGELLGVVVDVVLPGAEFSVVVVVVGVVVFVVVVGVVVFVVVVGVVVLVVVVLVVVVLVVVVIAGGVEGEDEPLLFFLEEPPEFFFFVVVFTGMFSLLPSVRNFSLTKARIPLASIS